MIRIPLNAHKLEHLVCDLDSFEHYISSEEDMVAVMHRSYDHFPAKDVISMADLNGKPLIFCRRFQSLITSTCFDHGYEAHVICLCDDTRNSVEWAEKGLGITLAHSNVLNWSSHPDLVIKTIDEPVLRTKQVYLWRKDRYISAIARNFLEIIQSPAPENAVGEVVRDAFGDMRDPVPERTMGEGAHGASGDMRDPVPERTMGEGAHGASGDMRDPVPERTMGEGAHGASGDMRDPVPGRTTGGNALGDAPDPMQENDRENTRGSIHGNDPGFCVKIV